MGNLPDRPYAPPGQAWVPHARANLHVVGPAMGGPRDYIVTTGIWLIVVNQIPVVAYQRIFWSAQVATEVFLPELSVPAQQAIGVLWAEAHNIPVADARHWAIGVGFNPAQQQQRARVLAHLNAAITFFGGDLAHPGNVAAGTELRQCHLLYAPAVIDAAGVVQVPASTLQQWNSPPDLTDNLLRRAIRLSMGQTVADVRRIAVAEVRRIGFFGLMIAVGRMGQIPAGKLARILTSQNGPGNNTINTAAIVKIWKVLSALYT